MKEDKILPRIKEYQLAFRALDIGMSEENAYKVSKIVEYMLNTETPDIKGLCSLNREILERLGQKYESISDRILSTASKECESETGCETESINEDNVSNDEPESIGPDWSAAPEWANYWAVDASGYYFWYEYEPILTCTIWDLDKDKYESCRFEFIGVVANTTNWQTSLQKRPNQQ